MARARKRKGLGNNRRHGALAGREPAILSECPTGGQSFSFIRGHHGPMKKLPDSAYVSVFYGFKKENNKTTNKIK